MGDTLIKGVAYHGNRMLSHVREDMMDLARNGFNAVVHMFSHNDMIRHKNIMKEIIKISEEFGLKVYIDNWGLSGAPGEPSHFLSWYPNAHQVYNNGNFKNPAFPRVLICFNNPDFIEFTKEWIDSVIEIGGKRIMWDEPFMISGEYMDDVPKLWTCRCETCRRIFKEKYGFEMPVEYTKEVNEFRVWTFKNYFNTICSYGASKGIENSLILKVHTERGIGLSNSEDLFEISSIHNIGTDPYQKWNGYENVYTTIYPATLENVRISKKYNKGHHLWIKGFGLPPGEEDDIIAAADAIYDAGAREIFIWGYRGSEANDYRMPYPETAWKTMIDAMARITERHRNEKYEAAKKIVETDKSIYKNYIDSFMK